MGTDGDPALTVDLRTQLEVARAEAAAARRRHQEDIEAIGQALLAEAAKRDWCDEYDEAITAVNEQLYVALPQREREYTMSWTEVYTVRVDCSTTVTATGEDDARGQIESVMGKYSPAVAPVGRYQDSCYDVELLEVESIEVEPVRRHGHEVRDDG